MMSGLHFFYLIIKKSKKVGLGGGIENLYCKNVHIFTSNDGTVENDRIAYPSALFDDCIWPNGDIGSDFGLGMDLSAFINVDVVV